LQHQQQQQQFQLQYSLGENLRSEKTDLHLIVAQLAAGRSDVGREEAEEAIIRE